MNRPLRSEPSTVYVIAGPNGAGKTTFASQFLPDYAKCRQFLNADLIAAGLSPFAPETRPCLDAWQLYDASRLPPVLVAEQEDDKLTITDADLFGLIQRGVGE
jgi:predicted ABC-type ATPase